MIFFFFRLLSNCAPAEMPKGIMQYQLAVLHPTGISGRSVEIDGTSPIESFKAIPAVKSTDLR